MSARSDTGNSVSAYRLPRSRPTATWRKSQHQEPQSDYRRYTRSETAIRKCLRLIPAASRTLRRRKCRSRNNVSSPRSKTGRHHQISRLWLPRFAPKCWVVGGGFDTGRPASTTSSRNTPVYAEISASDILVGGNVAENTTAIPVSLIVGTTRCRPPSYQIGDVRTLASLVSVKWRTVVAHHHARIRRRSKHARMVWVTVTTGEICRLVG